MPPLMSLQSRVSRRLAQLRVEGQLLLAPRPWPCPSAGATRTRSSACAPPASLGAYGPRARIPVGIGVWGAAAVGPKAGVRTWAPLAMAAKVDLSTSTDWKEAKCKCKKRGAKVEGGPTCVFPGRTAPCQQSVPPKDLGKLRPLMPLGPHSQLSPSNLFTQDQVQVSWQGSVKRVAFPH